MLLFSGQIECGRDFLAVRQGVNMLCAADADAEQVFLGGSPVSFALSSSY